MKWFEADPSLTPFTMFSWQHLFMITVLAAGIIALYLLKNRLNRYSLRRFEVTLAIILIFIELGYHIWLVTTGNWRQDHALPLELCNISLILIIIVLLTKHRATHEIVLFIGVAGALQAIFTPVLSYGLPHFRFIHFFSTHILIIWVAVYFTIIRDYRPTFASVWKALLFLNLLLPVIVWVNNRVGGNYWFLTEKPGDGSLLDFLGPYPWDILSLEVVAIFIFLGLWLVFRKK